MGIMNNNKGGDNIDTGFIKTILEERVNTIPEVSEYPNMEPKRQNLGCFFVGSEGPRNRGKRLLSNSEQLPDSELPPEVEEGNIEYKLKLVSPNPSRLEHLVTQMKWRLREGQGEAVYEIGVTDKGHLTGISRQHMDASVATLTMMSKLCDAEIIVLKEFGIVNGKVVVDTSVNEKSVSTHITPEIHPENHSDIAMSIASDTLVTSAPIPPSDYKPPAPKQAWGDNKSSTDTEKCDPPIMKYDPPEMTCDSNDMICDGSDESTSPDNKTTVVEMKYVAEILVRKSQDEDCMWTDLRIAMLGNVDAGKSTLTGVLTHGELDNGSGKARLNLFRHLHEIQSGHTSSISREIMGFDRQGTMFTYENHSIESILDCSSKVITFIDLAGSQKYLKTTVFGLTGHSPDYAALVVNSKAGLVGTFKEHLGLTVALRVLSFVCLTKIDGTSPSIVRRCRMQIENILKSAAVRRPAFVVNTLQDAEEAATHIQNRTPVFMLSAVTGENLPLLQHFLSHIPPALSHTERLIAMQAPPRFAVDGVLSVTGPGIILTGLVTKGTIREEDSMLLGPFEDKTYQEVRVASIQCNRLPRRLAKCGQSVSLAFHHLKRTPRKGMILQSKIYETYCVEEFTAEIFLLQHPAGSKLKKGFEATVFIESIRQKVEIIQMDREIATGQKAKVKLKFVQYPDVITVGAKLFFRNGRTKGMGTVCDVNKIPSFIREEM